MNNKLLNPRTQIDKIDSQLINLFHKRSNIVREVKTFKESKQTKQFQLFIKPKREFDILSQVIHSKGYNPQFYYQTWRNTISASNFLEQPLQLASICKTSQIELFQHFGGQQMPQIIKSTKSIHEDQSHIFAFKETQTHIFQELTSNTQIKIFAQIPSFTEEKTFICGKISLEDFSPPAFEIKWNNKLEINPFSNQNTNLIGAFYPLVI